MPKANYLAAKEVAELCNMTPKNFRSHLRKLEIAQDRKQKQYQFTQKQADKIVEQLTAKEEKIEAATA